MHMFGGGSSPKKIFTFFNRKYAILHHFFTIIIIIVSVYKQIEQIINKKLMRKYVFRAFKSLVFHSFLLFIFSQCTRIQYYG